MNKYYEKSGSYLKDHKDYFTKKQLDIDVSFLRCALSFKKTDKILDLACGDGRHTLEIMKKGFDIDGLDFSNFLIKTAMEKARKENIKVKYYKQDIHSMKTGEKYDKVFLFFSDLGILKPSKLIKNVIKVLKPNGSFLLDSDNIFRLISYLKNNPKDPYDFDFRNQELIDKKTKEKFGYYTCKELTDLFEANGLKVTKIYGDYNMNPLTLESERTIIVGKLA